MIIHRIRAFVVVLALLLSTTTALAGPDTPHFRFVPDEGAEGAAQRLAELAEAKRHYVLGLLGTTDERPIEVRIASSEASMERMVGTDRPVREWIAGLAIARRDLIVLSTRGNEVFHVADTFVHELAHVLLDRAVGGRAVPRWFNEGVAMLAATEDVGERLRSVLAAAATGSFIPLEELVDGFPAEPPAVHLAYAESMVFLRHLQKLRGAQGLRALVTEVRQGLPFDLAFQRVYGATPEALWTRVERTFDPAASMVVFLTSASLTWFLIGVLFLVVYARKRRRAARKEQAWELEDQLALSRLQSEADEELPN